jgi:hypothetical protein
MDESGIGILDVPIDGSVGHSVPGPLRRLGAVVRQPAIEVLDLDAGHHLRHDSSFGWGSIS